MIIRTANQDDIAAVARVAVDTLKETYPGIMPQHILDSANYTGAETHWARDLFPYCSIFLALDNTGNAIGYAGGGTVNGELNGYTGELGFIYLLKSHQHQGIGHKLAATVAQYLQQLGHQSMYVWVLTKNPYKRFYETLGGMVIADRQANFAGTLLSETAYGWKDLDIFDHILENRL